MPDVQLFGKKQTSEEDKGKHKMFGHKEALGPSVDNVNAISSELSLVNRRVRVLEERYNNLRRKSQLTEQNMLATNKKSITDIKALTTEIDDIKKEVDIIKSTIRQVIDELKKTAKREEVKVLSKYINLWEPIKFVTHEEVEKIVKYIVADNKNK